MKIFTKILLITFIVFAAIQFVRPARNNSSEELATDITKTIHVPDDVLNILKNSCYDCHTNNSRYPWYANIQPVGWMMAKHIKAGKADLNLSEFGTYSGRKQANKLRVIESSIRDRSMPIKNYTMMHRDATLSNEDKDLITKWVSLTRDSLMKN